MTYKGELGLFHDTVVGEAFINNVELRLAALIKGFYDEAISLDLFTKTKSVSSDEPVEYIVLRVTLAPSDKGIDIQNNIEYKIHMQTININFSWFFVELVSYNITDQKNETIITVPKQNQMPIDILKRSRTKQIGNNTLSVCLSDEVDPFKKVDLCPHIKTSFDEIPMTLENDFLYAPGNLTLSMWEYAIHGNDILICLDEFEILYEKLTTPFTDTKPSGTMKNDRVRPKQLLSLVCVCLSIACLLVTIVIYTAFSELHSQPGINNIILCACLLLAQVFYQFGAGQSSLKSWACALIGGICHFMWLSLIFSMNACCIQMFRIFKSPAPLKSKFD